MASGKDSYDLCAEHTKARERGEAVHLNDYVRLVKRREKEKQAECHFAQICAHPDTKFRALNKRHGKLKVTKERKKENADSVNTTGKD
jgi:hypothetical protein